MEIIVKGNNLLDQVGGTLACYFAYPCSCDCACDCNCASNGACTVCPVLKL